MNLKGTQRPPGTSTVGERAEVRKKLEAEVAKLATRLGLASSRRSQWLEYVAAREKEDIEGGGVTSQEDLEDFLGLLSDKVTAFEALSAITDNRPSILEPQTSRAVGEADTETLRPQTLARYVRLAWFAAERIVPVAYLENRSLTSALRRGRHGREKRPIWELLWQEWNRLHPGPLDGEPSVRGFTRKCHRALSHPEIQKALIAQSGHEYKECWDRYEHMRNVLVARFGVVAYFSPIKNPTPEEKIALDTWEQEWNLRVFEYRLQSDYQHDGAQAHWLRADERDAEPEQRRLRDRLTRVDLIALHLRVRFFAQVSREISNYRMPDRMRRAFRYAASQRPPVGPDDVKIQTAPLRDWFLPEAAGGKGSVYTRDFAHLNRLAERDSV